ncbi:protein kinase domain-containing protein [Streptomyces roseus]|uniref:non-specific serine/threonine protein kinase n=1 Tax=Streptomyces roseus TaxID=66430 RepID=A0A0J6XID7_9ACTN|nr:protein kinase [Streptomyces roseus]KMO95805.1 hypothetical protein ACS04_21550 [Streptomyces roseus]
MNLHPMHPAAWVLDQLRTDGWHINDLLAFTRASTLVRASRPGQEGVVLKAGFGSNHVLAELDPSERPAAYGFYWYAQMTETERALTREDFRHEAELTAAAGGADHIVPLLEQGSSGRFDWYTMPHCDGGNFRAFMATSKDTGKGLSILADVADGLSNLHQRGIVHRDVYQENILIDQGRGLITDLGAARRLSTPRGPEHRGPEVHWPPEYLTGYHEAAPAADVFSLGVLVYRYLCADIPRLAGHPKLPLVPEPLRGVVTAALSDGVGDRPAMNDLRFALRTAADLHQRLQREGALMPRARSPPFSRHHSTGSGTSRSQRDRKAEHLMNQDRITDFLANVEDLRGEDETVRTTAHTSSVSAEGWPAAEAETTTA